MNLLNSESRIEDLASNFRLPVFEKSQCQTSAVAQTALSRGKLLLKSGC